MLMRRILTAKPGEVIRFTKWNDRKCEPYIWAVCTYLRNKNDPNVTLIYGFDPNEYKSASSRRGWCISMRRDKGEIMPEEEWPDEVCVALAKHVLLGSDNN
jgi:hypothetical protein